MPLVLCCGVCVCVCVCVCACARGHEVEGSPGTADDEGAIMPGATGCWCAGAGAQAHLVAKPGVA